MSISLHRFPLLILVTAYLLFGLALPINAAPTSISASGVDARQPMVAVTASGNIHVVWEQEGGLWHRYHSQNGWSPGIQIVEEGEDPTLLALPDSDRVYLAWSQSFGGNYEIFTSRWDGTSWSPSQNVSDNDGGSFAPTLTADAFGRVHLFWSDTNPGTATIFHAASDDGLLWPTVLPVPAAQGTQPTAVFATDGTLWLAWQYRPDFLQASRIWTAQRVANSWQPPVSLTDGSQQATQPHLDANARTVVLAWQEGDQVRLARRLGSSWGQYGMAKGDDPALALTDNDFVYWAWENDSRIAAQYRHTSWSEIILGPGTAKVNDVALAKQQAHVYTVWTQQESQGWQIYIDSVTLGNHYFPLMTH